MQKAKIPLSELITKGRDNLDEAEKKRYFQLITRNKIKTANARKAKK